MTAYVCEPRRSYVTVTRAWRQSWARNALRPWMCPSTSCRAVNPAGRAECESCSSPKPRLQGWKCVQCKTRNHRGVAVCRSCREPVATSKDFWMCAVCEENNRIDEIDDNSRCGHCGYDMAPLTLTEEQVAEMNEKRELAFQAQQERFDDVSARDAEEQLGSSDAGAEGELPPHMRQPVAVVTNPPRSSAPTSVHDIPPFTAKPPETRHSRIYRRQQPRRVGADADAVPPGPPGFDWMCRSPTCARVNPGDEETCLGCGTHITPAEWECPQCAALNHLSRARCFNCHTGIPVSWSCPSCQTATSVYEAACRTCTEPRPAAEPRSISDVWAAERASGAAGGGGGGGGGGPQFRPRDWYCTACNGLNFSRRTECYQCGTPRRQGSRRAGVGAGGGTDGMRADKWAEEAAWSDHTPRGRTAESNNWVCVSCQASNFRTRRTCWQCGVETSDAYAGRAGLEKEENLPHFEREGFQDASDSKPAEGRMNVWKKTDDWVCAKCFTRNFRGKMECYKCGSPRTLAVAPRRASVRKPAKL